MQAKTLRGTRQNNHRLSECGRYAFIELTQGKEVKIDAADLEKVLQYRWHTQTINSKHVGAYSYAATNILVDGKRTLSTLNKLLGQPSPTEACIPINGDTLDCTSANLGLVKRMYKPRRRARNKTGYIGVTWVEHFGCYQAMLKVNGKEHLRFGFKTAEEAFKARQELERQYRDPTIKRAK